MTTGSEFLCCDQTKPHAVTAKAAWTLEHLPALQQALAETFTISASDPSSVRYSLDLSEISRLDTAGAWALLTFREAWQAQGGRLEIQPGSHDVLLNRVAETLTASPPSDPKKPFFLIRFTAQIGQNVFEFVEEALRLLGFFGLCLSRFASLLTRPKAFRLTAFLVHVERAGWQAMPIIGLLSFLIGVVLAYQSAFQLKVFGASHLTVNVLGIGVLREFGILLSAILVAGRSGSAFCAQIGTMKVNQEVDALRAIGLDPILVLVLPRLLALILVMPLLTVFANMSALAGGCFYALIDLDMTLGQFLQQLQGAVGPNSLWVGLIKAPVFGFLIAMVGCHEGLKVAGSADSVGRHTTQAVVISIFLVILWDALFSILFSLLGI